MDYNVCLVCGLSGAHEDDVCLCGGMVMHYTLPVYVDEVA
jgi:hypothetical protein